LFVGFFDFEKKVEFFFPVRRRWTLAARVPLSLLFSSRALLLLLPPTPLTFSNLGIVQWSMPSWSHGLGLSCCGWERGREREEGLKLAFFCFVLFRMLTCRCVVVGNGALYLIQIFVRCRDPCRCYA
jgi:hypothetical protein